ncbi:MAG: 6-carboxytetrahydropterin synthase [Chlorobia bacterium]|nr:6-carboxytetrahydropterin synthase [Fimbriimonadaceae bacterium]
MARKLVFSSGHRYWSPELSADENQALYGRWASPYSHGHNYSIFVTVEGVVDPKIGMVCNIKKIDDVVKERIISVCDQKSLNDEVPYFKDRAPSLENLMKFIQSELTAPGAMPPEAPMVNFRLEEMPTFYGEMNLTDTWKMNITRIYNFSAGHRLHNDDLSETENLELYGKCFNPAGHGHNYILEVTVEGEPDPKSGMLISLDKLDEIVSSEIIDRYDHKNLNVDVPELAYKITTCEVVAQVVFNILKEKLPVKLARIRLQETPKNIFEVAA